ncbi:MAG TPA: hypothetical protein VJI13_02160 [Candidatus Norongarragalinales archaeon]|nr:hypothetical protein [Candidatus Norongarragalinales archaeon]
MAIEQRRIVAPAPQLTSKMQMKQKIQNQMELLRIASGAHSIQGFGRMSIGAIVLSMIFSLATLLSVLYPYFSERIPDVARYAYPLLAGVILYLFYVALKYIREGFLMFEESKGQEDAALEKFTLLMLEDL